MGGISPHREDEIFQNIIANDPWVALHDGSPSSDGSTNEISGDNYSRVQLTESEWDISGSDPAELANDIDISFPEASGDWGTITAVSLWDSETGGNCELTYDIETDDQREIKENDTFEVATGNLTFTID